MAETTAASEAAAAAFAASAGDPNSWPLSGAATGPVESETKCNMTNSEPLKYFTFCKGKQEKTSPSPRALLSGHSPIHTSSVAPQKEAGSTPSASIFTDMIYRVRQKVLTQKEQSHGDFLSATSCNDDNVARWSFTGDDCRISGFNFMPCYAPYSTLKESADGGSYTCSRQAGGAGFADCAYHGGNTASYGATCNTNYCSSSRGSYTAGRNNERSVFHSHATRSSTCSASYSANFFCERSQTGCPSTSGANSSSTSLLGTRSRKLSHGGFRMSDSAFPNVQVPTVGASTLDDNPSTVVCISSYNTCETTSSHNLDNPLPHGSKRHSSASFVPMAASRSSGFTGSSTNHSLRKYGTISSLAWRSPQVHGTSNNRRKCTQVPLEQLEGSIISSTSGAPAKLACNSRDTGNRGQPPSEQGTTGVSEVFNQQTSERVSKQTPRHCSSNTREFLNTWGENKNRSASACRSNSKHFNSFTPQKVASTPVSSSCAKECDKERNDEKDSFAAADEKTALDDWLHPAAGMLSQPYSNLCSSPFLQALSAISKEYEISLPAVAATKNNPSDAVAGVPPVAPTRHNAFPAPAVAFSGDSGNVPVAASSNVRCFAAPSAGTSSTRTPPAAFDAIPAFVWKIADTAFVTASPDAQAMTVDTAISSDAAYGTGTQCDNQRPAASTTVLADVCSTAVELHPLRKTELKLLQSERPSSLRWTTDLPTTSATTTISPGSPEIPASPPPAAAKSTANVTTVASRAPAPLADTTFEACAATLSSAAAITPRVAGAATAPAAERITLSFPPTSTTAAPLAAATAPVAPAGTARLPSFPISSFPATSGAVSVPIVPEPFSFVLHKSILSQQNSSGGDTASRPNVHFPGVLLSPPSRALAPFGASGHSTSQVNEGVFASSSSSVFHRSLPAAPPLSFGCGSAPTTRKTAGAVFNIQRSSAADADAALRCNGVAAENSSYRVSDLAIPGAQTSTPVDRAAATAAVEGSFAAVSAAAAETDGNITATQCNSGPFAAAVPGVSQEKAWAKTSGEGCNTIMQAALHQGAAALQSGSDLILLRSYFDAWPVKGTAATVAESPQVESSFEVVDGCSSAAVSHPVLHTYQPMRGSKALLSGKHRPTGIAEASHAGEKTACEKGSQTSPEVACPPSEGRTTDKYVEASATREEGVTAAAATREQAAALYSAQIGAAPAAAGHDSLGALTSPALGRASAAVNRQKAILQTLEAAKAATVTPGAALAADFLATSVEAEAMLKRHELLGCAPQVSSLPVATSAVRPPAAAPVAESTAAGSATDVQRLDQGTPHKNPAVVTREYEVTTETSITHPFQGKGVQSPVREPGWRDRLTGGDYFLRRRSGFTQQKTGITYSGANLGQPNGAINAAGNVEAHTELHKATGHERMHMTSSVALNSSCTGIRGLSSNSSSGSCCIGRPACFWQSRSICTSQSNSETGDTSSSFPASPREVGSNGRSEGSSKRWLRRRNSIKSSSNRRSGRSNNSSKTRSSDRRGRERSSSTSKAERSCEGPLARATSSNHSIRSSNSHRRIRSSSKGCSSTRSNMSGSDDHTQQDLHQKKLQWEEALHAILNFKKYLSNDGAAALDGASPSSSQQITNNQLQVSSLASLKPALQLPAPIVKQTAPPASIHKATETVAAAPATETVAAAPAPETVAAAPATETVAAAPAMLQASQASPKARIRVAGPSTALVPAAAFVGDSEIDVRQPDAPPVVTAPLLRLQKLLQQQQHLCPPVDATAIHTGYNIEASKIEALESSREDLRKNEFPNKTATSAIGTEQGVLQGDPALIQSNRSKMSPAVVAGCLQQQSLLLQTSALIGGQPTSTADSQEKQQQHHPQLPHRQETRQLQQQQHSQQQQSQQRPQQHQQQQNKAQSPTCPLRLKTTYKNLPGMPQCYSRIGEVLMEETSVTGPGTAVRAATPATTHATNAISQLATAEGSTETAAAALREAPAAANMTAPLGLAAPALATGRETITERDTEDFPATAASLPLQLWMFQMNTPAPPAAAVVGATAVAGAATERKVAGFAGSATAAAIPGAAATFDASKNASEHERETPATWPEAEGLFAAAAEAAQEAAGSSKAGKKLSILAKETAATCLGTARLCAPAAAGPWRPAVLRESAATTAAAAALGPTEIAMGATAAAAAARTPFIPSIHRPEGSITTGHQQQEEYSQVSTPRPPAGDAANPFAARMNVDLSTGQVLLQQQRQQQNILATPAGQHRLQQQMQQKHPVSAAAPAQQLPGVGHWPISKQQQQCDTAFDASEKLPMEGSQQKTAAVSAQELQPNQTAKSLESAATAELATLMQNSVVPGTPIEDDARQQHRVSVTPSCLPQEIQRRPSPSVFHSSCHRSTRQLHSTVRQQRNHRRCISGGLCADNNFERQSDSRSSCSNCSSRRSIENPIRLYSGASCSSTNGETNTSSSTSGKKENQDGNQNASPNYQGGSHGSCRKSVKPGHYRKRSDKDISHIGRNNSTNNETGDNKKPEPLWMLQKKQQVLLQRQHALMQKVAELQQQLKEQGSTEENNKKKPKKKTCFRRNRKRRSSSGCGELQAPTSCESNNSGRSRQQRDRQQRRGRGYPVACVSRDSSCSSSRSSRSSSSSRNSSSRNSSSRNSSSRDSSSSSSSSSRDSSSSSRRDSSSSDSSDSNNRDEVGKDTCGLKDTQFPGRRTDAVSSSSSSKSDKSNIHRGALPEQELLQHTNSSRSSGSTARRHRRGDVRLYQKCGRGSTNAKEQQQQRCRSVQSVWPSCVCCSSRSNTRTCSKSQQQLKDTSEYARDSSRDSTYLSSNEQERISKPRQQHQQQQQEQQKSRRSSHGKPTPAEFETQGGPRIRQDESRKCSVRSTRNSGSRKAAPAANNPFAAFHVDKHQQQRQRSQRSAQSFPRHDTSNLCFPSSRSPLSAAATAAPASASLFLTPSMRRGLQSKRPCKSSFCSRCCGCLRVPLFRKRQVHQQETAAKAADRENVRCALLLLVAQFRCLMQQRLHQCFRLLHGYNTTEKGKIAEESQYIFRASLLERSALQMTSSRPVLRSSDARGGPAGRLLPIQTDQHQPQQQEQRSQQQQQKQLKECQHEKQHNNRQHQPEQHYKLKPVYEGLRETVVSACPQQLQAAHLQENDLLTSTECKCRSACFRQLMEKQPGNRRSSFPLDVHTGVGSSSLFLCSKWWPASRFQRSTSRMISTAVRAHSRPCTQKHLLLGPAAALSLTCGCSRSVVAAAAPGACKVAANSVMTETCTAAASVITPPLLQRQQCHHCETLFKAAEVCGCCCSNRRHCGKVRQSQICHCSLRPRAGAAATSAAAAECRPSRLHTRDGLTNMQLKTVASASQSRVTLQAVHAAPSALGEHAKALPPHSDASDSILEVAETEGSTTASVVSDSRQSCTGIAAQQQKQQMPPESQQQPRVRRPGRAPLLPSAQTVNTLVNRPKVLPPEIGLSGKVAAPQSSKRNREGLDFAATAAAARGGSAEKQRERQKAPQAGLLAIEASCSIRKEGCEQQVGLQRNARVERKRCGVGRVLLRVARQVSTRAVETEQKDTTMNVTEESLRSLLAAKLLLLVTARYTIGRVAADALLALKLWTHHCQKKGGCGNEEAVEEREQQTQKVKEGGGASSGWKLRQQHRGHVRQQQEKVLRGVQQLPAKMKLSAFSRNLMENAEKNMQVKETVADSAGAILEALKKPIYLRLRYILQAWNNFRQKDGASNYGGRDLEQSDTVSLQARPELEYSSAFAFSKRKNLTRGLLQLQRSMQRTQHQTLVWQQLRPVCGSAEAGKASEGSEEKQTLKKRKEQQQQTSTDEAKPAAAAASAASGASTAATAVTQHSQHGQATKATGPVTEVAPVLSNTLHLLSLVIKKLLLRRYRAFFLLLQGTLSQRAQQHQVLLTATPYALFCHKETTQHLPLPQKKQSASVWEPLQQQAAALSVSDEKQQQSQTEGEEKNIKQQLNSQGEETSVDIQRCSRPLQHQLGPQQQQHCLHQQWEQQGQQRLQNHRLQQQQQQLLPQSLEEKQHPRQKVQQIPQQQKKSCSIQQQEDHSEVHPHQRREVQHEQDQQQQTEDKVQGQTQPQQQENGKQLHEQDNEYSPQFYRAAGFHEEGVTLLELSFNAVWAEHRKSCDGYICGDAEVGGSLRRPCVQHCPEVSALTIHLSIIEVSAVFRTGHNFSVCGAPCFQTAGVGRDASYPTPSTPLLQCREFQESSTPENSTSLPAAVGTARNTRSLFRADIRKSVCIPQLQKQMATTWFHRNNFTKADISARSTRQTAFADIHVSPSEKRARGLLCGGVSVVNLPVDRRISLPEATLRQRCLLTKRLTLSRADCSPVHGNLCQPQEGAATWKRHCGATTLVPDHECHPDRRKIAFSHWLKTQWHSCGTLQSSGSSPTSGKAVPTVQQTAYSRLQHHCPFPCRRREAEAANTFPANEGKATLVRREVCCGCRCAVAASVRVSRLENETGGNIVRNDSGSTCHTVVRHPSFLSSELLATHGETRKSGENYCPSEFSKRSSLSVGKSELNYQAHYCRDVQHSTGFQTLNSFCSEPRAMSVPFQKAQQVHRTAETQNEEVFRCRNMRARSSTISCNSHLRSRHCLSGSASTTTPFPFRFVSAEGAAVAGHP